MTSTTNNSIPAPNPLNGDILRQIEEQPLNQRQPVLFHNAFIRTHDPLIGAIGQGDILLGGSVIVGVGPGLVTAAGDDNMLVVDCTGLTIVPVVIDTLSTAGLRSSRSENTGTLVPGNRADFAVLTGGAPQDYSVLLEDPASLPAVVVGGEVLVWNGRRRADSDSTTATGHTSTNGHAPGDRLGTWISEDDFLHQELTPDGRYDETRGGRPHAFQGQYWISGNRIDYLDDLGFWAYGEFTDGTLHHAGYAMQRQGH